MVRIKICGITRADDAQVAIDAGADALGFIFVRESPRYVTPEAAEKIIRTVPPFISRVGVFVNENPDTVMEIAERCGLDTLQLHGDETPEYCSNMKLTVIRAFRMSAGFTESLLTRFTVGAFLFDTAVKGKLGGTGETFDWKRAVPLKRYGPLILAGGLRPGNVAEAIRVVGPYGVDVSSGVEANPGIKDHKAIKEFIRICRERSERF